jgi:hypothetical protein
LIPVRAGALDVRIAGPRQFLITPPPGWGYSLPFVYLIWAAIVLALYPLCRWFAGVKQRRSDAWLSYF